MSTQAQYASTPKCWTTTVSAANPNRDGTGTMAVLGTAAPLAGSGTRVDKLQIQARGDTTTGTIRLFLAKGAPGAAIASITFSSTTATITTSTNHGLTTGDLATIQNAMPDVYNVTNGAVTVTAPTTFTVSLPSAPTTNAIVVGGYSVIKAAEVPQLWREVPVLPVVVTPRAIASISFSGLVATLVTSTPHGLATGDTIVVTGATPAQYNGTYVITVTNATTLTYVMASAPATNASVVGSYSVPKSAFSAAMHSQSSADLSHMPLVLQAGWQLRVATNNAETFNVTSTFAGDL